MKPTIIATDKYHLLELIEKEIKLNGYSCDLNHIDVTNVANMYGLFTSSQFCGDISKWDVSHVKNMVGMFYYSKFTGDLSDWKPYSATLFNKTFENSTAPIPYWANYRDKEQRKKAIDSYWLDKELNLELNKKDSQAKRIKL
jgi:hypothetical protein